jgi:CCR4-NOT transcription complex subunit 6
MNTKDCLYSWHLSLRVDRPVEGCTIRPHAYMYGKKLDDRDLDKPSVPHSKKSREPPPAHEFSFRWFRGPPIESCAYEGCPRRTSFSPHDWSMHALGGSGCSLQCVSTQSSLFKCTFCNSKCFVHAWKSQYTVSKDGHMITSGATTPIHRRSGSFMSNDDDTRSIGSSGSFGAPVANGTRGRNPYANSDDGSYTSNLPGTPRAVFSGYNNTIYNDYGSEGLKEDEWLEISQDQVYLAGVDDVGRKLKVEAAAYSLETGELLMMRVVKTDLVLSRAPDPVKRNLVTAKSSGQGGGARFRIATYNVLAEIYATQQQYPYCDFWALSWDYR